MNKLNAFFDSQRQRLNRTQAPEALDHVLTEAFVAAGLSPEEIRTLLAAAEGEDLQESGRATAAEEKSTPAEPILHRIESMEEKDEKNGGRLKTGGKAAEKAVGKTAGRRSRRKRALWIPAVAACAALLLIATSIFSLRSDLTVLDSLPSSFRGVISVEPLAATDSGIDPEKGFVITSTEPLAEEVVKKALVIEPAVSYTLERKKGGSEYLILPDAPLESGSVYKISFDPQNSLADQEARANYTWAFQTAEIFELQSLLPADYSDNVPVDTAVQLTFSREPDQKSLEESVRITPAAAGKWQVKGDTATFLPAESWAPSATYEIAVAGDVKSKDGGDYLGKEVKALFRTAAAETAAGSWTLSLSNDSLALRPDETPVVGFHVYHDGSDKTDPETVELQVKLYQYESGNQFKEALASQTGTEAGWVYQVSSGLLPTKGLKEAAAFTASCPKIGYQWFLTYPQALEPGFYLAEYRLEEECKQQLIQVTYLSAYLAANDEEALIWVNDLSTGQPVQGAALAAGKLPCGVTDSQGTAYIPSLPETEDPLIFTVNSKDRLLYVKSRYGYDVYTYGYGREDQSSVSQDYWYYLKADKPLYHPGENLQLFGLAAPRTKDAKPLDNVTVQLKLYDSDSRISRTFSLEDGVLSGEFPMPVLKPGYYSLEMYSGEAYICSAYIEIATYEKASYQITFNADKKGVMAGEAITWTAVTSFFDGTPLPDQAVTFSGSGIKNDTTITSDLNGEIRFTTRAQGEDPGYLVGSNYVSAEALLPEIGDTYSYQWVRVLNSDLDITGRAYRSERDPREFSFEMEVFEISADQVTDWSDYGTLAQQARQEFQGVLELRAEVTRQYWEKVETGKRLDPYTRLMEPVYEYIYHSVSEPDIPWQYDGAGQATFKGRLESEDSYQIRVYAEDRSGRSFYRDFYIPPTAKGTRNEDNDYIWLQREDEGGYVKIGEKVDYCFYSQDAPLASEGYCLFFTSGDKINDYVVSRENTYQVQFTEEDIPGLNVSGVYFDGKSYSSVAYATSLLMDTQERSLNLKITTDKQSYSPGDLVNMELLLTDSQGNPRPGVINLNILDEALLAIEDLETDMADQVFWGNLYSFDYSFTIMNGDSILGPMAEGGGDGGIRENFQDSALFTTVTADEKGQARVSFTLPDNITSWRAVWQAYVPGIWVGSGSVNIIAGLPFFTDLRFNGPILSGDKAVIGLRAAGREVSKNSQAVAWKVSIPEAGFTRQLSGAPFTWQSLELPALEAGNYTLLVEAACLSYSDTLKQSFQVVETRQSYQAQSQKALTEGAAIPGSPDSLTTLIFSDTKRSQALEGLMNLAGQNTVRLEQRIAALKAGELLASSFGYTEMAYTGEEKQLALEAILNYQNEDGGVGYLPYSQSDLRTSVRTASFGGEYLSKNHLADYFEAVLKEGKQDPTLALWGLAASGKPVLTEMKLALESGSMNGEALSGQQMLNLACGLLFAGDGNYAKPYVEKLLDRWTEDLGSSLRAKVSDDRQETIQATAQMAAAAGLLELEEAEKLYAYLLENLSAEDPCLLEQLAYLQGACRRLPAESGFSYTLGEDTEAVSLTKVPVYRLSLTPRQLKSVRFSQISGDITVTSLYRQAGRQPQAAAAAEELKISRSYQGGGRTTASLPATGKILVVIDYEIGANAPDGYYELVDYLPAGLRYVSVTEDAVNDRISFLSEKENQLTFCLDKSGEGLKGQLRYYVRVAMPGTYLAEPAALSRVGQPGVYAVTEEARVYIN